jgi:hypothetical protein
LFAQQPSTSSVSLAISETTRVGLRRVEASVRGDEQRKGECLAHQLVAEPAACIENK